MEPAVTMVTLWGLFAGTHIGLATAPIRRRLVARLGESGFIVLFSAVAAVSFTALVSYYAAHRFDGMPGLAAGAIAPVRWGLVAVLVAAFALMTASLVSYPRSPYALFVTPPFREPRGVERITRHGFFASTAVFAVAHTLLATRLVGAVFAAGFAVLSLAGAWHQDRKLLARYGTDYGTYLDATSTLPFGAIIAQRQRLVVGELPLGALGAGAGIGVVLRLAHDQLFAWGGLAIVAAVVGGGALETVQSWRRGRRLASRSAAAVSGSARASECPGH
jgi:uncharacterized membrane protein